MSPQLVKALLDWRRVVGDLVEKGKSLPAWAFPPLEGTPFEERDIRHVFTRMLTIEMIEDIVVP